MSAPSNNPFIKQFELLMTGYGYNFYSQKNQVRADDLLIRQKASKALYEAAEKAGVLEIEYQRRFIPAATRENPFPPAEAMNRLRDLTGLRERLRELATKILGMPVPTQDKIWWKYRDEASLLNRLIQFDSQLVIQAEQLYQHLHNLTAEIWNRGGEATNLNGALQYLADLIRERQQFLQFPI